MRLKNKKSFTLLEIILAISIFSLVILTVYSTFWAGVRLSAKAQTQGDVYRQMRWMLSQIEQELQNALSYDLSKSYPDRFSFSGGSSRLVFLMVRDDELKVVSYHLLDDVNEGTVYKTIIGQTYKRNVDIVNKVETDVQVRSLVRDEYGLIDYLHDPVTAPKQTKIIATNIPEGSLKFSFAQKDSAEGAALSWQSTWEHNKPPMFVRLETQIQSAKKPFERIPFAKDIFIPHGTLDISG